MLPVTDIQRDQPGDEEFRARWEAATAEKYANIPEDRREGVEVEKYEDAKWATGIVTHGGGGRFFVQASEDLVRQTGGDPAVVMHEEAFMVLMNGGNREPLVFTRIEPIA